MKEKLLAELQRLKTLPEYDIPSEQEEYKPYASCLRKAMKLAGITPPEGKEFPHPNRGLIRGLTGHTGDILEDFFIGNTFKYEWVSPKEYILWITMILNTPERAKKESETE